MPGDCPVSGPPARPGASCAGWVSEDLQRLPVVEIMTLNFRLLANDQIVTHAAKMHAIFGGQVSVPKVIRVPGGADPGDPGAC